MADKELDKPSYNKDAFKDNLQGAKEGALSLGTLGIAIATPLYLFGSIITTNVQDGAITDRDLFTGPLNAEKNFSHVVDHWRDDIEHDNMFLVRHDDGGFALYKRHETDTQRLIFVEYDEALPAIEEMSKIIEMRAQELLNSDLSPFGTYGVPFADERIESEVSLPYEFNGTVERISKFYSSSDILGADIEERFAQELALWQEAASTIQQDSERYGVNEDILMDISEQNFGNAFLHNLSTGLPYALAPIGFLGLLGGGIGYAGRMQSRRKEREKAAAKDNKKSKAGLPAELEMQLERDIAEVLKDIQATPQPPKPSPTPYKPPEPRISEGMKQQQRRRKKIKAPRKKL